MKISLNAIRFINQHYKSAGDPAPNGVDDVVQKIGAQLGGVDEVIPFGERFKNVLIAEVKSCQDHPNADKLHVCMLDDGGVAQNVERDENGYVQVVCGAPNVRAGISVAWLPPGATVPSTFGDNEFVMESRALRGVMSNGMLASPKELSLSDAHDGILEIDKPVVPGTTFAEAYHLESDVIVDIENKMFTHRPDCFGWLGVARELEGIQQRPYTSPEWYTLTPEFPSVEAQELPLTVVNEVPELVPRFSAITMANVTVKPSPVWLQVNLARAGMRPINNIVDYTNFFMLLTGQPLHAYDYDKVQALSSGDHASIVVRKPRVQETLALLNGKKITLKAAEHNDVVIASDTAPIGLGGVMGSADTEVDNTTTRIILECANFDMYVIRKTSMKWGLFTDAVTRFNKGQSPLQNLAVLAKIVDEIRTYAGGKVASRVIDDCHVAPRALKSGSLHAPVTVTKDFINSRLGLDLSLADMTTLLTNVEFSVRHDGDNLVVAAPFWRTDIAIEEDIVEEVGRLYGYDHLPRILPRRDLTPAVKDPMLMLKSRVRALLSGAGANEVLTYNFVHGELLAKAGQDSTQAFQLSNALSPDLQYYRMSLMPSLLEKVHPNIKAGFNEFALFEMNKTHNQLHTSEAGGPPAEFSMLGFVVTTDEKSGQRTGASYYDARVYLDYLAEHLGLELAYSPITTEVTFPVARPYNLQRSALVSVKGGESLGIIGEFQPSTAKKLKLPARIAGFEIGLEQLLAAVKPLNRYKALSRFPSTEQDICFRVDATTPFASLMDTVQQALAAQNQLITSVSPLDIFKRDDDAQHVQMTVRITLQHPEKTLTSKDTADAIARVAAYVAKTLQAERV